MLCLMTRRMGQGVPSKHATLALVFAAALFAAACTREAPPAAERTDERSPASAEPDEPSDELDEEDGPDRPVEELAEEELEAECYRGRREACDLLGH
jgi:hypothetical protein